MSSSTQPGRSCRAARRNATPLSQGVTAKPDVFSMNAIERRTASSSSTTCTMRRSVMAVPRFGAPHREMEYRATTDRRLGPDAAAMRLDDRAGDRQAQSHALFLSAGECLEQARGHRGVDARPGIRDRHVDHPAVAAG
ncbi:hypothetical protein LTR94_033358, partial [Friedmanniomyces endolithicus]